MRVLLLPLLVFKTVALKVLVINCRLVKPIPKAQPDTQAIRWSNKFTTEGWLKKPCRWSEFIERFKTPSTEECYWLRCWLNAHKRTGRKTEKAKWILRQLIWRAYSNIIYWFLLNFVFSKLLWLCNLIVRYKMKHFIVCLTCLSTLLFTSSLFAGGFRLKSADGRDQCCATLECDGKGNCHGTGCHFCR